MAIRASASSTEANFLASNVAAAAGPVAATAAMSAAGCFVVSNTTQSGTVGILYSVGDFSAVRTLAASDVLNVTVTLTSGQQA